MSCFFFLSLSTELVELKIEEFLASFEEKLNALTEEAFKTQVCVCVCIILCICEFPMVMEKVKNSLQVIHIQKSFRSVRICSSSYFLGLVTDFLTML